MSSRERGRLLMGAGLLMSLAMTAVLVLIAIRAYGDGEVQSQTASNCGPGAGSGEEDCYVNSGIGCNEPFNVEPTYETPTLNTPAIYQHLNGGELSARTVLDQVGWQWYRTKATAPECRADTDTWWYKPVTEPIAGQAQISSCKWSDGTTAKTFTETTTDTLNVIVVYSIDGSETAAFSGEVEVQVTVDTIVRFTASVPDFSPVGVPYTLSAIAETNETPPRPVQGIPITFSGPFPSATATTNGDGLASASVTSQSPVNDASVFASHGTATDTDQLDIIAIASLEPASAAVHAGDQITLQITCTRAAGWPNGEVPSLSDNGIGGTFSELEHKPDGSIAVDWTAPADYASEAVDQDRLTATYGSGEHSTQQTTITVWKFALVETRHFNDFGQDGRYKIDTGTAEFEARIEPPMPGFYTGAYAFDFGDESTATDAESSAVHVYPAIDTYTCEATIEMEGMTYTSTCLVELDYSQVYPIEFQASSELDFPGIEQWITDRISKLSPSTGVNAIEIALLTESNPFTLAEPPWNQVSDWSTQALDQVLTGVEDALEQKVILDDSPSVYEPLDFSGDEFFVLASSQTTSQSTSPIHRSPLHFARQITKSAMHNSNLEDSRSRKHLAASNLSMGLPATDTGIDTANSHSIPLNALDDIQPNDTAAPTTSPLLDAIRTLRQLLQEAKVEIEKIEAVEAALGSLEDDFALLVQKKNEFKAAANTLTSSPLSVESYKTYLSSLSAFIAQMKATNQSLIALIEKLNEFRQLRAIIGDSITVLEEISSVMQSVVAEIASVQDILGLYTVWNDALRDSIEELHQIRYSDYANYFNENYLPVFGKELRADGTYRVVPGKYDGFSGQAMPGHIDAYDPCPDWIRTLWGDKNCPTEDEVLRRRRLYTSSWEELSPQERTELFQWAFYCSALQEAAGVDDWPVPGLPTQLSQVAVDHVDEAAEAALHDGERFLKGVKENLLVLLPGKLSRVETAKEALERIKLIIDLIERLQNR